MSNIIKFFKNIKLSGIILSLILIFTSYVNIFALDNGIYLVPTTTYYVNPETGEVDDIGSGDVALGEAMTRSALGETALLEVQDGKSYITLRLKLISNISNIKIATQNSKGGAYSTVSTTVKAENFASDYADYRFEVKNADNYICLEFYVAPMGRNVKFYASVDTSKAVAGSGDFVTTIKLTDSSNSTSSEKSDSDTVQSNSTETTDEKETSEKSSVQTVSEQTQNTTSTQSSETKQTSSQTTQVESSNENSQSESSYLQTSTESDESNENSQVVDNSSLDENEEDETGENDTLLNENSDESDNEAVETSASSQSGTSKSLKSISSNNSSSSGIWSVILFAIIIFIFIFVIIKFGKR